MNFPTSYVSVDTETTGLYPMYGDKIIQLSAAKYVNDELKDTFDTFINPEGTINRAEAKNNISSDDLISQPTFDEVVDSFKAFVDDLPWVGHNLNFDLRFLLNEGMDVSGYKDQSVDVLSLARRTFGRSNNQLWRLEKRFNIENAHQHRSLDDAIATAEVYQKIRDLVPEPVKSKRHTVYKKHVVADVEDQILKDTTIVFTGHFDLDNRDELRHLVEKHGGHSPNIVSKKTDYLVLGVQTSKTKNPNHSSKEIKAMECGTPIIDINDFLDMLGGK